MSTSLNDVVFEIYRELDGRREKILQDIKDKERETEERKKRRLSYKIKMIGKNIEKLCRHVYKFFFPSPHKLIDDYRKLVADKNEEWHLRNMRPNVFIPTSKKFPETRIAVYTCITGGYDEIKDPFYADDDIDYYAVTDTERHYDGQSIWKFIPVPSTLKDLNSVKRQRYIKLHPDEIISWETTGRNYDYTFYIDGSLRITCDIKPLVYSLIEDGRKIAVHTHSARDCIYDEAALCCVWEKLTCDEAANQMNFYRSEGMPEHFGLLETPVLIRRCNDEEINHIMSEWWGQYLS